jgi:hypothetical protein
MLKMVCYPVYFNVPVPAGKGGNKRPGKTVYKMVKQFKIQL